MRSNSCLTTRLAMKPTGPACLLQHDQVIDQRFLYLCLFLLVLRCGRGAPSSERMEEFYYKVLKLEVLLQEQPDVWHLGLTFQRSLMQTFAQVVPDSLIRHPRSGWLKGSFNTHVNNIPIIIYVLGLHRYIYIIF